MDPDFAMDMRPEVHYSNRSTMSTKDPTVVLTTMYFMIFISPLRQNGYRDGNYVPHVQNMIRKSYD